VAESKHEVEPEIQGYFAYRDQMTVQDGLVFCGERVVVQAMQRKNMKEKLHSSHIGSEGCLRRARECLFWPNMADEIKDYVGLCATCQKYEIGNPNETLMSHEVPDRPWAKIGADLS